MARPTAGTTSGHVAAIYVRWGESHADAFFKHLRETGITLLGGNGPVAEAVARKEFTAGLTDIDDVKNVQQQGAKVSYCVAECDKIFDGALYLPTTVALVANRPANSTANQLVDYLLSAKVEQAMIDAQFIGGWGIRSGKLNPKPMPIDYTEVAKKMPEAVRRATAILEGREP
jgi:ABC-type Fe3+ transport system substrate-binding protein